MSMPGFTAERALGRRRRGYGGLPARRAADARLVEPQEVVEHCSDDDVLCYFCDLDDPDGCSCDWYVGDHYLVSSDCGRWN